MNISLISVRYAKAFFKLAVEKNIITHVYTDMVLFSDIFKSNPEFEEIIENPVLSIEKKTKIFYALFTEIFAAETIKFFNLVLNNRREIYLKDIARNLMDMIRKHMGVKKAEITSSAPLNEQEAFQIQKAISTAYDSEIELSMKVDEKLIGGFVLRIDDQQIDNSFSAKLKKIKQELLETTLEI